jgi:hypothetical protein
VVPQLVVKDHSVAIIVLVVPQEVETPVPENQTPSSLVTLVLRPNKTTLETSSKNVEILRMLEFP